jgi:hypothetical protein
VGGGTSEDHAAADHAQNPYLVTEDWSFVSHFLPMAQAARDCLQVLVATPVRADGERLEAEGFSVIAIESRRRRSAPSPFVQPVNSRFTRVCLRRFNAATRRSLLSV